MYKQEEINPYHEGEKAKQVEQMFDNIAPTYDTLNHRLSWDIDKGWRKKAIGQLAPHAPKVMLDIATGTGDFAILSAYLHHALADVGTYHAGGLQHLGGQDGEVACACGYIEQRLGLERRQSLDGLAAPTLIDVPRQTVVKLVVGRGDVIKHLLYLRRFFTFAVWLYLLLFVHINVT